MYQERVLENGLKILLVPVSGLKSVSVGIFVGVGSRYENEAESGMAHFIEHMLFKGTSRRPSARLVAEAIEGIGGISNAYTDHEVTVYHAKVAAAHVGTAIDVLADLVRHPLFELAEFEKERYVIGEELNMVYDSPDSWVEILADQLLWPNHPLGRNVAGTHQSLAGMSRDSLVSFYRAGYHPHNVLIAIGGAFEAEPVVAKIADLWAGWQPTDAILFEPAPGAQTEARWRVEDRSIEQGHLCLALPGLPRTHPDRYKLSLLNAILGDGMSSRLFLSIREDKGLAYDVDSSLSLLSDTGSMMIYAGVDPERGDEALQAILDELDRLREEPIPEQELRKTKEYLKGRLLLGLEDSFSQASWVAYQSLFMDSVKTPEEVLKRYDAVTAAEVQAVAQRIISPTAYNLAVVGPFGAGEALGRLIIDKS